MQDRSRANRDDQWGARGQVYKEASERAAGRTDLSQKARKKLKTELCKEMATDFLAMLQESPAGYSNTVG